MISLFLWNLYPDDILFNFCSFNYYDTRWIRFFLILLNELTLWIWIWITLPLSINKKEEEKKKEVWWNLLISSFCNYNFLYGSCIQLLALLDSNRILIDLKSIIYFFLADDQDEYVVPIVYVVISNTMWSPFQLRCLAQAFTLMYYSYHSNQDIVLAAAPSEEQNRLPLLQSVYFELQIY